MNLREAIVAWIESRKPTCSPVTINNYLTWMRKLARCYWDPQGLMEMHPAKALAEDKLTALYVALVNDGKRPGTVNMYSTAVKMLGKWLYRSGALNHRQYTNVSSVNARRSAINNMPNKTRIPFTESDYKQLVDMAEESGSLWNIPARLGWETGIRLSDCLNLTIDAFDIKAGTVTFVPGKTAYRKPNPVTVPLTQETVDIIRDRIEEIQDEDPTEKRLNAKLVGAKVRFWKGEGFKVLCKMADIKGKSFHCLRHGLVSRLKNAGVDTLVICSITGQSPATVARYTVINMDTKMKALQIPQKTSK